MSNFKHTTASIVLALSTFVAAGSAAQAGGDAINYGSGLSRHRVPEAVPVPAPAPVPDTQTGYYVRIDAAYSQSDTSKYRATDPHADLVRGDSNLDNFPRFGLGAGYQFSRWFRMDATFDIRDDVESRGAGQVDYRIANGAGGTNTTIAMRDTITDNFTSSNTTGLINAYFDAPVSHSFTPYVGVGVGFVRHQVKGRAYTRSTQCVDTVDCNPAAGPDRLGGFTPTNAFAATGGTDYALAAAAMAGFTYKVWDSTKLDLGYRYLHLGGTTYASRNNMIVENLRIPAQNIHELRVGVRYDIN